MLVRNVLSGHMPVLNPFFGVTSCQFFLLRLHDCFVIIAYRL